MLKIQQNVTDISPSLPSDRTLPTSLGVGQAQEITHGFAVTANFHELNIISLI